MTASKNRFAATVSPRLQGLAVLAVVVLVTGCSQQPGVNGDAAPELARFESEQAFRDFLTRQMNDGSNFGFGILEGDVALGAPVAQTDPGAAAGDAADIGFSATNIQESGVGESDVVQTDGSHLFFVDQDTLRIVRALPAERMEVVGSLQVEAAAQLYLHGTIAVVLGNAYRELPTLLPVDPGFGAPAVDIAPYYYSTPLTVVSLVDVSNPAAPVLMRSYQLDGWLVSSRLIGPTLHVVLGTQLNLSPLAEGENQEVPVESVIPDVTIASAAGSIQTELMGWADIYHQAEPTSSTMTAVVSIDVQDDSRPFRSAGILTRADTVYVAPDALYIANVVYPAFMGSPLLPFAQVVSSDTAESTAVYQFALGADGAELVGSGKMPGRLLDRYSLSAHQGRLRAATTVGQVSRDGSIGSLNNVYVLGLEDGQLNIIGRLEGLAPGEQIYSARFVGDRGFLVTFKKVDPLFTLDLSDPTAPKVVGELKIPGYSDYIHPLGPDHLLTIGKDAVDTGEFAWYQGVQLSLFDVTTFADPQRLDVEIIGDRGTESEALYDPHAFNYYPPLGMLAVPMTIAQKESGLSDPAQHGRPVFHGLCLYRVSVDGGITPAGHLSTAPADALFYYGSGWTRGVFIGGHVYAVTTQSIQALPVDALDSEPQRLDLQPE